MSGTETEIKKALVECLNLLNEAGLFENLSAKTREFIGTDPDMLSLIAVASPVRLEPRLTLDEYQEHVLRVFKVPPHTADFYLTIVKVCYLMTLAEKNPIIAQQLRGVVALGDDIKTLLQVK